MEQLYRLWMIAIAKIHRSAIGKLLDLYGSAEAVFNLSDDEINSFKFLSPTEKEGLCNKEFDLAKNYLKYIEENNTRFLTPLDEDFPLSLFNIEDIPQGLFCRGSFIDFNNNVLISVVGARKCTQYGYTIANTLSKDIAKEGAIIVSGMALGIDSAAHEGALEGNMPTIAVFGCGVNVTYPASNHGLMKRIMETGMVISEYPMNHEPSRYTFPDRNRIISGISRGLIVVEAGPRSGSLITARLGAEQGKDLYAVPGNINCESSKGTNELIKDGARLVTCAADITFNYARELEQAKKRYAPNTEEYSYGDSTNNDIESALLQLLSSEPMSINTLAAKSEYSVADISVALLMLELNGKIFSSPNGTYSKNI